MIKMIKRVNEEVFYWEVWQDGKTLVIHQGSVGDTGETKEMKLSLFQRAEKVIGKLAEEKENEGYDFLSEEDLIELVIQYSYRENEMNATLEKRHHVEELMNECLGWTGNGYCDGGDIGSGTANIFNYVLDVEKAATTIINELKINDLLKGVKIAYCPAEDEQYIGLYPEGTAFDLI